MAPPSEQLFQELRIKFIVLGYQDAQRPPGRSRQLSLFLVPRGSGRRGDMAVTAAHHLVDRLEQLILLDRLKKAGVNLRLAKLGRAAGAVPGGQQDYARAG